MMMADLKMKEHNTKWSSFFFIVVKKSYKVFLRACKYFSRIEHQAQTGVPVTIDIFRFGNSATRLFDILNHVRDGVPGIAIVTE